MSSVQTQPAVAVSVDNSAAAVHAAVWAAGEAAGNAALCSANCAVLVVDHQHL